MEYLSEPTFGLYLEQLSSRRLWLAKEGRTLIFDECIEIFW